MMTAPREGEVGDERVGSMGERILDGRELLWVECTMIWSIICDMVCNG